MSWSLLLQNRWQIFEVHRMWLPKCLTPSKTLYTISRFYQICVLTAYLVLLIPYPVLEAAYLILVTGFISFWLVLDQYTSNRSKRSRKLVPISILVTAYLILAVLDKKTETVYSKRSQKLVAIRSKSVKFVAYVCHTSKRQRENYTPLVDLVRFMISRHGQAAA